MLTHGGTSSQTGRVSDAEAAPPQHPAPRVGVPASLHLGWSRRTFPSGVSAGRPAASPVERSRLEQRQRTGYRGARPAQGLRRARGGARHRPAHRARRGVRAARPQRRRQDDDGRDPRRPPRAHRRRGQRPRLRPRQDGAGLQGAHRRRPAGDRRRALPHGRRDGGPLPQLLPAPARHGPRPGAGRPHGAGFDAGHP